MDAKNPLKFLVYLPKQFSLVLSSLPFLDHIQDEFGDAEINILVHESSLEFFLLQKFNFNSFSYCDQDIASPMSIHKFSANLHDVFNVDVFFSLDTTFAGSFFGFCFQAKERIGFKSKMVDLFSTKKIEVAPELDLANQRLSLLKAYTGKEYAYDKFITRDISSLFEEDLNYVVVYLENIDSVKTKLTELLGLFENLHFLFLYKEDHKENFLELLELVEQKGTGDLLHLDMPLVDKMKLLAHSRGILTDNSDLAVLASFLGSGVVCLSSPENKIQGLPNKVLPEWVSPENSVDIIFDKLHEIINID